MLIESMDFSNVFYKKTEVLLPSSYILIDDIMTLLRNENYVITYPDIFGIDKTAIKGEEAMEWTSRVAYYPYEDYDTVQVQQTYDSEVIVSLDFKTPLDRGFCSELLSRLSPDYIKSVVEEGYKTADFILDEATVFACMEYMNNDFKIRIGAAHEGTPIQFEIPLTENEKQQFKDIIDERISFKALKELEQKIAYNKGHLSEFYKEKSKELFTDISFSHMEEKDSERTLYCKIKPSEEFLDRLGFVEGYNEEAREMFSKKENEYMCEEYPHGCYISTTVTEKDGTTDVYRVKVPLELESLFRYVSESKYKERNKAKGLSLE